MPAQEELFEQAHIAAQHNRAIGVRLAHQQRNETRRGAPLVGRLGQHLNTTMNRWRWLRLLARSQTHRLVVGPIDKEERQVAQHVIDAARLRPNENVVKMMAVVMAVVVVIDDEKKCHSLVRWQTLSRCTRVATAARTRA